MAATLVWFRQDLRLQDNPALLAAVRRGGAVVPVYVLDDAGEGHWPMGRASRWWLHHSLVRLDECLRARGSRLLLAKGESGTVLRALLKQAGATAVYWNRRYEPARLVRDRVIETELNAAGVDAKSYNSALLFEPSTVQNKTGGPFQVFTPFWKHCQTLRVEEAVKLPRGDLAAPAKWPRSLALERLDLLPRSKWDEGLGQCWVPGEVSAMGRWKKFVADALSGYADRRNIPDEDGTSMLSPHLHFGEIGPRQIWASVRALSRESGVFPVSRGGQVFLSEVGWREFAHHLLYHFPRAPEEPLRPAFAAFSWARNTKQLRVWQRGLTGYPIVDAGMRQLGQTGWMHNRVRMIVASFLVKHLRLSWQEGAAWFWDTLVDADLAGNTLGWQWTAGCGADAAPYFRIFNPVLQGMKFDPNGSYVRHWVPELAGVPAEFIHRPWEAPEGALTGGEVGVGRYYPQPIVNHGEARGAALAAWRAIRARRS